jgi:serine/threonine protein kinase
VRIQTKLKK